MLYDVILPPNRVSPSSNNPFKEFVLSSPSALLLPEFKLLSSDSLTPTCSVVRSARSALSLISNTRHFAFQRVLKSHSESDSSSSRVARPHLEVAVQGGLRRVNNEVA